MKNVIWKYTLGISDEQTIQMPKGGQILTVQTQNEIPQIWVLVNPENDTEPRKIKIIGTGHNIEYFNGKYIGTFQMSNGTLIFHAFEMKLPKT